jgi:hypothetical protein
MRERSGGNQDMLVVGNGEAVSDNHLFFWMVYNETE